MRADTSERGGSRAPLVAIAAFAIAAFVAHRAGSPPAALSLDADPARFSAARARESLARILGDEAPHPVGSSAHAAVVERLVRELRAVGVEPEVQESLVAGRNGVVTRVRNVVATIGSERGGPSIALAAHHDSVGAGPGASDDGAGVAAVVECARALRAGPPLAHPLVLLVTDGEEVDLAGACAFVREHPLARDVRAVVNLEARGTEGLAFLFQTGPGVGDAIARFGEHASRPATSSIAALVYEKLPNDTDLSVFLRAGWTGLNFAFIGGFRRYHTPRDDLAHLDARSLQQLGDGALAGLRALDALDLAAPHAERGERVWHDVLGRFVVGWPRAWSGPLALLALAGLAAAVARRARAKPGARAAIARGAVAALLAVVASAGLAWGVAAAHARLRDASDPWFAALDAWHAAALVLALFAAFLGAALLRRRGVRATDAYLGGWTAFAATGAVVAFVEPAACLLFVAPSLVAAAAAWVLRTRDDERAFDPRLTSAVLAPFVALAVIWIPFLQGVELALGFAAGFVPGALAGVAAAALVPLLAGAGRSALVAAAAAALAAACALALAPDRTADAPIWTNIAHVQTGDAADWAVATYGAPLPDELRGGPGATKRLVPWLPGIPTAHVVPAARHAEPPPLGSTATLPAEGRAVATIASRRGATTLVLGYPRDALEIVAIRSGGLAIQGPPPQGPPLVFVGVGPEGVEVEYAVRGGRDWSFDLADVRSGFPASLAPPFAAEPTRVPRGRGDVSIVTTTFGP